MNPTLSSLNLPLSFLPPDVPESLYQSTLSYRDACLNSWSNPPLIAPSRFDLPIPKIFPPNTWRIKCTVNIQPVTISFNNTNNLFSQYNRNPQQITYECYLKSPSYYPPCFRKPFDIRSSLRIQAFLTSHKIASPLLTGNDSTFFENYYTTLESQNVGSELSFGMGNDDVMNEAAFNEDVMNNVVVASERLSPITVPTSEPTYVPTYVPASVPTSVPTNVPITSTGYLPTSSPSHAPQPTPSTLQSSPKLKPRTNKPTPTNNDQTYANNLTITPIKRSLSPILPNISDSPVTYKIGSALSLKSGEICTVISLTPLTIYVQSLNSYLPLHPPEMYSSNYRTREGKAQLEAQRRAGNTPIYLSSQRAVIHCTSRLQS